MIYHLEGDLPKALSDLKDLQTNPIILKISESLVATLGVPFILSMAKEIRMRYPQDFKLVLDCGSHIGQALKVIDLYRADNPINGIIFRHLSDASVQTDDHDGAAALYEELCEMCSDLGIRFFQPTDPLSF